VLNAIPATAGAVAGSYLAGSSITQAKLSTNVAGNGPAFCYSIGTVTSLPTGTFTKLTYDTSVFDTTGGMYASSRFTPTIAGYYQINASISGIASFGTNAPLSIFKNGGWQVAGVNINGYGTVSGLVYCNGSTDYIEIQQYQGTGSTQSTAISSNAQFSGFLARSA
jgi:hypothetical protein